MLGDSMVKTLSGFLIKKLNSFLLTQKLRFFFQGEMYARPCQLFDILTQITLYYIVGLMTRILTEHSVRLLERL